MKEYKSLITDNGETPYINEIEATIAYSDQLAIEFDSDNPAKYWNEARYMTRETFIHAIAINEYLTCLIHDYKNRDNIKKLICKQFVESPKWSPLYYALTDYHISYIEYHPNLKNASRLMYGYAVNKRFDNQKDMYNKLNHIMGIMNPPDDILTNTKYIESKQPILTAPLYIPT